MGLDGVELVMEVEEAFAITIADDEASAVRTVGDLHDLVLGKLSADPRSHRCASAAAFYRLRRAQVARFGHDRRDIRPRGRMDDLVPVHRRRASWRVLARDLGWRFPPLRRPGRLEAVLMPTVVVADVVLALLPEAGGWGTLGSFLLLYILAFLPLLYLVLWLTSPFAVHLPEHCRTVRGATLAVLALNPETWASASLRPAEVWSILRAVVVEQLGVRPEQVTEDARLVEDLGLG